MRALGLSPSRTPSSPPSGKPDSKSRNDLGAGGEEIELKARPFDPCSASFAKIRLDIKNGLKGLAVFFHRFDRAFFADGVAAESLNVAIFSLRATERSRYNSSDRSNVSSDGALPFAEIVM